MKTTTLYGCIILSVHPSIGFGACKIIGTYLFKERAAVLILLLKVDTFQVPPPGTSHSSPCVSFGNFLIHSLLQPLLLLLPADSGLGWQGVPQAALPDSEWKEKKEEEEEEEKKNRKERGRWKGSWKDEMVREGRGSVFNWAALWRT